MVEDPADYRWSSYGEAVGGGRKGNGKKAREGLVRAITSDTDTGFDAGKWKDASRRYRRLLGMALERKTLNANVKVSGKMKITKNEAEALEFGDNQTVLPELKMPKMLRCRVRYFTDGAVIGSKDFVNDVFSASRNRFPKTREDGARVMKGPAKEAGRGVVECPCAASWRVVKRCTAKWVSSPLNHIRCGRCPVNPGRYGKARYRLLL